MASDTLNILYINKVEEEVLMREQLPTHSTGDDIFNLSVQNMAEKVPTLKQYVVCADVARSMA
jgi:hypothetical protein